MSLPRLDRQFVHQAVRDLAFLLCAPSPWRTRHDMPRERLLGPNGATLLSTLDASPGALCNWVAAHRAKRLGHYAEQLLAFWFELAPHIELVKANLVLRDGAHTLGEFDFLLRVDGEPWHIETASKFYLQVGAGLDSLLGPSLRDAWVLKANKLERQLALSCHPLAPLVLPPDFIACRCGALVAGRIFYGATPFFPPPLAPDLLHGWIASLDSPWPRSVSGSRWLWLPRLRWLSDARAEADELQESADLQVRLRGAEAPQMVAEMVFNAGAWCEVARGFLLPSGWPDTRRLNVLREMVANNGGA